MCVARIALLVVWFRVVDFFTTSRDREVVSQGVLISAFDSNAAAVVFRLLFVADLISSNFSWGWNAL